MRACSGVKFVEGYRTTWRTKKKSEIKYRQLMKSNSDAWPVCPVGAFVGLSSTDWLAVSGADLCERKRIWRYWRHVEAREWDPGSKAPRVECGKGRKGCGKGERGV